MKASNFIYIGCVVMLLIVVIAGTLSWYLNYASEPKFDSPTYENGKLVVQTTQGKVLANDIYQLEVSTVPEAGTLVFVTNEDSIMSFNPALNEFIIVLKRPEYRVAVEKNFLKILGITAEQGCQLDVVMGIPYEISPEASQDFNLSFCNQ